ncbi:DUF6232 family protein [Streptomyces sp. NBC_00320]|uniref:DUF6232 family protein n=1 Tax=Streptomyces sp. NBC_00320 TaxID=2975711 RepID=UPI00225467C9|nr:DUF6232 family protein [Streptomyces sp. NBC_00320]MCX5146586.1 DUF6232 family protein [Streptomyces sp. NBC_00320]
MENSQPTGGAPQEPPPAGSRNAPQSGHANGSLPAGPSAPPPPPSAPPASPPSMPPQGHGIELRISRRILWVGGAAYPLESIARVYTFTLNPRRKDATIRFLKNLAVVLASAFALTILAGLTSFADRDAAETILSFVWLGAAAALVWSLVEWGAVLTASSHYVLAVETSGPSIAVVTSKDPGTLHQLVGQITHAIDNPDTELYGVRVDTIVINPRNYHFGDNVNMYGGSNNVGMGTR